MALRILYALFVLTGGLWLLACDSTLNKMDSTKVRLGAPKEAPIGSLDPEDNLGDNTFVAPTPLPTPEPSDGPVIDEETVPAMYFMPGLAGVAFEDNVHRSSGFQGWIAPVSKPMQRVGAYMVITGPVRLAPAVEEAEEEE